MRLARIKLKHWSRLYHWINGHRTLCGLLTDEEQASTEDVSAGVICATCALIKKSYEK